MAKIAVYSPYTPYRNWVKEVLTTLGHRVDILTEGSTIPEDTDLIIVDSISEKAVKGLVPRNL